MSDPSRWYSIMPDGSVRFDDPLSGKPVRTGLTPELIESEPEFNAGIAFVLSRTDQITIIDFYHLHEFETDLGALDENTFRDFIRAADYHGTELPGLSNADVAGLIRDGRNIFNATIFDGYSAFRQAYQDAPEASNQPMIGHQTRLFHVLAQTVLHTPSFNMDLRPDNTQLEADMLKVEALWGTTTAINKLAKLAFTRMRDWCMIGGLSLELMRREMGKPARELSVVTNAGFAHLDKTRKEKALGLNATARYLQPNRISEELAGVYSRVGRTGVISKEDFEFVPRMS